MIIALLKLFLHKKRGFLPSAAVFAFLFNGFFGGRPDKSRGVPVLYYIIPAKTRSSGMIRSLLFM